MNEKPAIRCVVGNCTTPTDIVERYWFNGHTMYGAFLDLCLFHGPMFSKRFVQVPLSVYWEKEEENLTVRSCSCGNGPINDNQTMCLCCRFGHKAFTQQEDDNWRSAGVYCTRCLKSLPTPEKSEK